MEVRNTREGFFHYQCWQFSRTIYARCLLRTLEFIIVVVIFVLMFLEFGIMLPWKEGMLLIKMIKRFVVGRDI